MYVYKGIYLSLRYMLGIIHMKCYSVGDFLLSNLMIIGERKWVSYKGNTLLNLGDRYMRVHIIILTTFVFSGKFPNPYIRNKA